MADHAPPAAPAPPPTRTFGVDVLLTVGGKAIFVLSGALITVLVARHFGPGGQGIFAVAFSLTLLLVQFGGLGLPIANPYYAAREPHLQRAIALHSLRLALVVAGGLAIGTCVVKALAPAVLRGLTWPQTLVTLAAIPAALATLYLQGVLLGRQRMIAYNLVDVAQVGSSLVAIAILMAVGSPTLFTVLLVLAAGRYLSLALAGWNLRDVLRERGEPSAGLTGRLLRHGIQVYAISLLGFALIRIDLLLVNAQLGAADTGQYSIAGMIAEGLTMVPVVVATNLVPRIATADGDDLTAAVVRVVSVVWGLLCLVSVPGALIGIPLVFGHRYDDAVALYAWLAPGTFCMGMLSALMSHYWVRGYTRELTLAWILVLAANVAGNLVLLPPLGVTIAPILSTVAYAAVLAVHLRSFARDVGGYGHLVPQPRAALQLVRAAFARS